MSNRQPNFELRILVVKAKKKRLNARMSVPDLASLLNIDERKIINWETGCLPGDPATMLKFKEWIEMEIPNLK